MLDTEAVLRASHVRFEFVREVDGRCMVGVFFDPEVPVLRRVLTEGHCVL